MNHTCCTAQTPAYERSRRSRGTSIGLWGIVSCWRVERALDVSCPLSFVPFLLSAPVTPQVPAVRLVNEAQLSALAGGLMNGVVVDIGESGTYVTPIFDGLPVRHAMQSQPCGGLDVTHYLDSMLLSRSNEEFNQMVRDQPQPRPRPQSQKGALSIVRRGHLLLSRAYCCLFFCLYCRLCVMC